MSGLLMSKGKSSTSPFLFMKIYIGTKKFDSWVTVETFKEFKSLLNLNKKIDAVYFDRVEYNEEDGEIIPLDTADCALELIDHFKGKKLPEIWIVKNHLAETVQATINHHNKSHGFTDICYMTDK